MEIKEATCPKLTAYSIRVRQDMKSMHKTIMDLFKGLKKEGLKFGGLVFTVYYEKPVEGQPTDYEMGATVKDGAGNSHVKTFGGMKCLHLQVKGSYSKLDGAWREIEKYIAGHGITKAGPPLEIYTKGPIL